MSRVDDDRDAARMAARLAEARRNDESKKADKSKQSDAFSKLVGQQKAQAQGNAKQMSARDLLAHVLEGQDAPHADQGQLADRGADQKQQNAFKSRLGTSSMQDKVQSHTRNDGEQAAKSKLGDQQGTAQTNSSRASDQGSGARGAQGRGADAKVSNQSLEERKEASDSASAGRAGGAGGARAEKGGLKTDSDKGGGQQGGGKDGKDGSQAMGPGFRFNPALMAPVPVAKQKDVSGSERLRKVANELAQKIVENVRVGTNAAGKVEFQIDLRGDVLAGLSVKVSSKNGKIQATFSGSDRDVLKLIEEQEDALKSALAARGLSLEDFKVEART